MTSDPLSHDELPSAVKRCLELLTERSRELFRARALSDRSYADLAIQFEMTGGAVGRVLSETRLKLQKCLESPGGAKKADLSYA